MACTADTAILILYPPDSSFLLCGEAAIEAAVCRGRPGMDKPDPVCDGRW
jgi:hypothetical protein